MNPRHTAGLVTLLGAAVGLAGCSQPGGVDGRMFEHWAQAVAAIPIDDGATSSKSASSASSASSAPSASSTSSAPARQAEAPLKIDLTDHADPESAKARGLRAAAGLIDSELAGLRSKISFKETATPDGPVAAPTEAGGFMAQLGAFPTRAAAESGWARLKASHPSVLGQLSARFEAVDLGGRGLWTRVQAGPFSARDQAAKICSGVGAPERWCVVARRG
jgi:cell division protein FtsN